MAANLAKVADGVHVGPLFARNLFTTVILQGPGGDVVVDAGPPWSHGRLTRFLQGRDVVEHVVTHAHGDHVGSSTWLCNYAGVPLAMSEVEADDFETGGSIAYHADALGRYLLAPMGRRRRRVDRRLREGDVVAGFQVLAQPGHSPGLLAFWREADRTLLVGDGPINVSSDSANPRWLPLPKRLHNDPVAAGASLWRMTRLQPELVVSTHGYPVRSLDRWIEGVRAVVH